MEPNLTELSIYIFFLGLIVQSLYRIFDPLLDYIKSIFKGDKKDDIVTAEKPVKEPIEPPIEPNVNNMSENHPYYDNPADYAVGQPDFRTRRSVEGKPTWKDLVVPPIIGLGVAWIFYPATVFDYLPFQPNYPIFAYIITAFIISRIANMEHDTVKTIGKFFMGVANKFYYR